MTNPTTDLLRVVELVQSVIAAEGTMHQPPRVEAAKEAAFALVREHGRTLLEALRDAERLDWLADPGNVIGNVQLPRACVEANMHSLRAAIDAARQQENSDGRG